MLLLLTTHTLLLALSNRSFQRTTGRPSRKRIDQLLGNHWKQSWVRQMVVVLTNNACVTHYTFDFKYCVSVQRKMTKPVLRALDKATDVVFQFMWNGKRI